MSVSKRCDPVLVIVKLNEVSRDISATEAVVWKRSPAGMDHHGSLSVLQEFFNISQVFAELDGVSKHPHPRLAAVGLSRMSA